MSLGTILLIVVILMLVGVLPVWPHASSWGYGQVGSRAASRLRESSRRDGSRGENLDTAALGEDHG